MCGRFYIDHDTMNAVKKMVSEMDGAIRQIHLEKDIYPTDIAPIIVGDRHGLKLTCQKWGYPGLEQKNVIYNARVESVLEKKIFSNGIRYHRAVIPVKHFYEWSQNREKNTFCRKDTKEMYLAGIFDGIGKEERFVILTTEANESMKKIHNRMPLILEKNQIFDWILGEEHTVNNILHQVPVLLDRKVEFEQMTLF